MLKLNNFTFNGEHYIQIKGTAMGTRMTPNVANVYMGRLENKFVYQTQLENWLIMSVCFTDDIFLIWKGDKDSLIDFLDYLNNLVPSIKFMHEIPTDSVNFLDTHHHHRQHHLFATVKGKSSITAECNGEETSRNHQAYKSGHLGYC